MWRNRTLDAQIMRKSIWIGAGVVALGLGMASCSGALVLLGCHNPTGYCGGSSNPDPDRIGGPSWFLWDASAAERLAHYRDRCSTNDLLGSEPDVTSCAVQAIKEDAHQHCVSYYLPPPSPKDEAEEAERNSNYERCKQDVLDQHGW